MCACMPHVYRCPWRPGEGVGSPGSAVTGGCEMNSGLLEGQQVLFSGGSSLLPPPHSCFKQSCVNVNEGSQGCIKGPAVSLQRQKWYELKLEGPREKSLMGKQEYTRVLFVQLHGSECPCQHKTEDTSGLVCPSSRYLDTTNCKVQLQLRTLTHVSVSSSMDLFILSLSFLSGQKFPLVQP